MFKNRFLILLCFVTTTCAPSPVQLTSTANFAVAQTETAASTATHTPSPTSTLTPTPTSTQTKTPVPTPLGGGIGELFFLTDGVYKVNSDGTGFKQIVSPSQIETIIGDKSDWAIYTVKDGQNYIITNKGFYIVTDDWKLITKAELKYSEYIRDYLDLDFEHIVWNDANNASGNEYITNGKSGTQVLLGKDARVIGRSADGNVIYFRRDNGKTTWSINSDGSNKQKLNLDALKNFTYSGIREGDTFEVPILDGAISNAYARNIDWMAISPDRTKVAFTWVNLLFIANANDLEFSNPRLIAELPYSSDYLFWSPDGNYLLTQLLFCENNSCDAGDIIHVNISTGIFTTVYHYNENEYTTVCGFSPDGEQIAIRYYDKSQGIYGVKLFGINNNSSIDIEAYIGGCPVWQ